MGGQVGGAFVLALARLLEHKLQPGPPVLTLIGVAAHNSMAFSHTCCKWGFAQGLTGVGLCLQMKLGVCVAHS